jgi:membrane protease YdiL (CAAX protease family)
MGIAFPLVWGKLTGNWAQMGFTGKNTRPALLWGVVGGVLTSIIGIAVLPERSTPSQIGLQLAIGVPIWALIASPFQEFFFRGWLQTRFENSLGNWWGLLLATACFTLWHYCAPFAGSTPVPLETPIGALATFGAGLVYAVVFQRTQNVIAPWLAHVISGITFIVVGAMDFTQPVM